MEERRKTLTHEQKHRLYGTRLLFLAVLMEVVILAIILYGLWKG